MPSAAEARRSNEEWLAALRGEDDAARRAQTELRTLVQGALRRATGGPGALDEATLEDLTQVAVLRVLEKLDRFEGRSRFTTWAYSVAVRAAFSELRKAPYRNGPPAEEPAGEEAADEAATGSARLERREIVDVLYRVLETALTEKQRTAVLGDLRGTPGPALAAELGTNPNALHKLMHDARARLHDGLRAAGITDDEVREAFGL
jgi:RNA polymerase sigma-70 factor (ECF subfamily)